MTTEEKAKAYDEALKRIREFYRDYDNISNLVDIKRELESIFPQLCESEDERTRKRLIEFISDIKRISESGRNSWAVRKDDAEMCDTFLSYLEKQKENPKSAVEVLVRAGLKPYKDGNQWCILAGDNIQEGICGFGDTIDDALYEFLIEVLEKQEELNHDGKKWIYQDDYHKVLKSWYMEGYKDHEHNREPKWIVKTGEGGPRYEENPKYGQDLIKVQKPWTFNEPYNPDEYEVIMEGNATSLRRKEQKPIKCIDFDNEFENQVSHLLTSVLNGEHEYSEGFVKYAAQSLLGYAKKEHKPAEWSEEDEKILNELLDHCNTENATWYNWLKSLRPVKQEWSKKDEDKLYQVMETLLADKTVALRETPHCEALHEAYDEMLAWLKSLRPSWKPSEEQMKVLERFVDYLHESGNEDYEIMDSFLEQIQKL